MDLILIDGGPASGKNTLGEIIVNKLAQLDENVVLLDLDTYVEDINPKWVWDNEKEKQADQLNARLNIAVDIDKYLLAGKKVIIIGERLLTKDDIRQFMDRIKSKPRVYLYHLSIPIELRERRLHQRGPHSLIDIKKDQEDRNAVNNWPGFIYENINEPDVDADNLISLIRKGKGLISR